LLLQSFLAHCTAAPLAHPRRTLLKQPVNLRRLLPRNSALFVWWQPF
jgi:hypothetical protein